MPVTSTDGRGRILGWLTHRDVLAGRNTAWRRPRPAQKRGGPVAQAAWPPATLLIAIRRHDTLLTPTDDIQFEESDRLTLVIPTEHADLITEHLQYRAPPAADSSA